MFLLFCILMYFLQVSEGTVEYRNVAISSAEESVRLDCDDSSKNSNQWKHESDVLFAGQNAFSLKFMSSVELGANYSLIIHSPRKIHEGRYKCIRNSIEVAKYYLEIQFITNVYIVIEEWNTSREIFLREGDFVTVHCYAMGARPEVTVNLMVNGLQMNSESETNISKRTNCFNLTTFDSMTKIKYQPNVGQQNVSCSTSGHFRETTAKIFFTVITPKQLVVVNIHPGQNAIREVYMEPGQEIFIECNAYSAKQFLNLSWELNHLVNISNTTVVQSSRYMQNNNTFHSQIFLRYHPQSEEIYLTCRAESRENVMNGSVSIKVSTYIPPVVSISANGETIKSRLSIQYKAHIKLRCEATGARPQVDLTIHSSEGKLSFNKLEKSMSQYLTAVKFEYQALTPNTSITCRAISSIKEQQRNRTIHVETIYEEVATGVTDETLSWDLLLLVGFGGLFVLFVITCVVLCLCISKKKNRGNGSPYEAEICLRDRTPRGETLSAQTSLQAAETEKEEFQKLAKIEQTIPIQNVTVQLSSDEDEYYSELEESKWKGRIFNLNEIRLLFNMEDGKIFSRWVGMLESTNCPARCVLLSTLKDDKELTSGIKWGTYLQRRLELPNTDHLARTEGLCIDGVKTYIISEYFTCGSLEMYLGNQTPQDSVRLTNRLSEVNRKALVLNIFSGIDFIHSYGFLHPGLSSKKLLVTDQGNLKLYDFCLSEDAPQIVRIIKKQMNRCMSLLAPEALSRNEYTKASDVWSIALVISELISKGFLRLVSEEDESDDATVPKHALYSEWFCASQHFDIMETFLSECWNTESFKRPTVREMRLQFEQMFAASNNHVSTSAGAASDLYIPMRSPTLTKADPEDQTKDRFLF